MLICLVMIILRVIIESQLVTIVVYNKCIDFFV